MGSGILGVLPKTAPLIFNKGESEMAKKDKYTHVERSKAAKKAVRTKRKKYGKDLKKG